MRFPRFLAALSSCLFALSVGTALADDVDMENLIQVTQNQVRLAMAEKNFAQLEQMATTFRDQKTRKQDGGWMIDLYYEAIRIFVSDDRADQMLDQYSKIFDEWRHANPNSPTPIIAKAELLSDYAWYVRGNGAANTVFDNQWTVFNEKVREAYKIATEAPDLVKTDPRWYSLNIRLMRAMGIDKRIIKRFALEGISREPDYYRTQIEYMRCLTPQWGGTPQELDDWIVEASAMGGEHKADGLYARMYWSLREIIPRAKFMAFPVSWDRMKQETDNLFSRYPSVSILEKALALGCQFHDADEVQKRWIELRKQAPELNPNIDPPSYCRWAPAPARAPGTIRPEDLRPGQEPQKASTH